MPEHHPLLDSEPAFADVADEILVDRSIDGDDAAFGALVTRHAPLMRAYTARIVGSITDADDVVQESFVIAWRKLPSIRDRAQVKAWLMRVATTQSYKHLRRRPADTSLVQLEEVAASADPEGTAIRNAQLRALSVALQRLPEDQRQCWLLREVAGLSYAEIAGEAGLTPAAVRGKLARARTSITTDMEGWR